MKRFVKALLSLVLVVLISIMGYSGYQLYKYYKDDAVRKAMDSEMSSYRPTLESDGTVPSGYREQLLAAQEKNADIQGWIILPGTEIDYPYVQADDNDFYLHRTINKDYASAGTLFMDCRCDAGFSMTPTLIYGHNMKNGSMFGTLPYYREEAFFNEHPSGWLFTADTAYRAEIFACLLVQSSDEELYSPYHNTAAKRTEFYSYIQQNALQYRQLDLSPTDKIVFFSTCAYDFEGARVIVAARLEAAG